MTRRSLPRHVGFIPDGNRRWAASHGLEKQSGYDAGIEPGLALYELCKSHGIPEVSVYGFTQDNTKRPSVQIDAFRMACVAFAQEIAAGARRCWSWATNDPRSSPRSCGPSGPGRAAASRSTSW
jgi:undecaprenyl diphosphate synthase